jgi:putative membrane protein
MTGTAGAIAIEPPSQTESRSAAPDALEIDAVDENFLHRAAVDGLADVSLGRLAASQATQTDVKKFGATLANERSKLNDRLNELAAQEGWELPEDVDADHRAKIDAVAEKDGLEFNEVFADTIVESQRATIELFRETAEESRVAAVREFAREALPLLERHLRMAQALQREVAGR